MFQRLLFVCLSECVFKKLIFLLDFPNKLAGGIFLLLFFLLLQGQNQAEVLGLLFLLEFFRLLQMFFLFFNQKLRQLEVLVK